MFNGRFASYLVFVSLIPLIAAAGEFDLPVPMQQYQQIRYYSAGVSTDERRQLAQLFPLKLVFSTDQGHMLSDTEVRITQSGRTVFQGIASNGPWLIIDLPPGSYDIVAVQDGKLKALRGVEIAAGKKRTLSFKWKTSEVNMGLR
jgi:hypothetical protein